MAIYWGRGNGLRWLAAGGVLISSGASAAYLQLRQPTAAMPDLRPMRMLAERLDRSAPVTSAGDLLRVDPDSGSTLPKGTRHTAVSARSRTDENAGVPSAADAVPTATDVTPVKSLALIGVTSIGGKESAWLVDLDKHEHFSAVAGQEVEGMQVRDIQPERVILTQNGNDYELRLGERPNDLLAEVPPPAPPPVQKPAPVQPAAQWTGRRGGGGGGSRGGYAGGGGFSGGFRGGYRGGYGGFGGYGGNMSQPQVSHATSNPQEARRRGVGLVGGVRAIPEPRAYFNPQTVRRLGSTSGHAFGADDSRHTGQINAASYSRSTRGR